MKLNKQLITTLLFLLTVSMTFSSCGQSKSEDSASGFTIDPNIKTEVEKYITQSGFTGMGEPGKDISCNNRMFIDFYQNDKLVISSKDSATINSLFKSFYYWQHDTLGIDGAFGLFTGVGFSIKIHNGKATLYHLLASDEIPSYAYKENDPLTYRLEIPCTDTKIILSEVPDSTKKLMIYGYAEFKSGEYFETKGSGDGKEFLPRNKNRANMKIYFRSISMPF